LPFSHIEPQEKISLARGMRAQYTRMAAENGKSPEKARLRRQICSSWPGFPKNPKKHAFL